MLKTGRNKCLVEVKEMIFEWFPVNLSICLKDFKEGLANIRFVGFQYGRSYQKIVICEVI